MITKHPDWILVEQLEEKGDELSSQAARLIKELKRQLLRAEDNYSRLRYPDTTGQ